MKTARFTDLVKKAGAPETYLLWVPPKQDRVFQRAVKENRILTIHQENVGTKKDYGLIGFHEEPNAQFLVFPKSVKSFGDRRIIGINYDLLAKNSRAEKPAATTADRKTTTKTAAKKPKATPSPTVPKIKRSDADEPEEKIVAFEEPAEKPAPPEAAPATQKRPKHATPARKAEEAKAGTQVDPRVLTIVKRTIKDLDAGKTVAAYKRLESLVADAEK